MKNVLDVTGKFPKLTCSITGITTELVQMSRSAITGREILTFRQMKPRLIHAQILKHRMFSISSESSRARDPMGVILNAMKYPVKFPHLGMNCRGMQAKKEAGTIRKAIYTVSNGLRKYINLCFGLFNHKVLKLHKQVINRDIERDVMLNYVVTATDFDHFFNLRIEDGADPVVRICAEQMFILRDLARKNMWLQTIDNGEWHVPFVARERVEGELRYFDGKGTRLTADEAKVLSATSCAQTSFRKNGDVYDPTHRVYKMLIESKPVHATPVEHQATPMGVIEIEKRHKAFEYMLDVLGQERFAEAQQIKYSGNFLDFIQHRKLIEGEKFQERFNPKEELKVA